MPFQKIYTVGLTCKSLADTIYTYLLAKKMKNEWVKRLQNYSIRYWIQRNAPPPSMSCERSWTDVKDVKVAETC